MLRHVYIYGVSVIFNELQIRIHIYYTKSELRNFGNTIHIAHKETNGAAKECKRQSSDNSNQNQKYELLLFHSLLGLSLIRMFPDESGKRVNILFTEHP